MVEAQNISAYIPTNLISITDGQVYLSPLLFQKALKNIADRLDDLRMSYHQQRQSLITEELMDVISGFEALTVDDG